MVGCTIATVREQPAGGIQDSMTRDGMEQDGKQSHLRIRRQGSVTLSRLHHICKPDAILERRAGDHASRRRQAQVNEMPTPSKGAVLNGHNRVGEGEGA